MMEASAILRELRALYGNQADEILKQLTERFGMGKEKPSESALTQRDMMLITYGDSLHSADKEPLQTLLHFLQTHVGQAISAVHLLPIYPYSSDDGFSVMDYRSVNPELGTWEDVHAIAQKYDLMLDAVINHASRRSRWFEGYLACEKPYDSFFITCDENADYSAVIRPRALPLLTCVQTRQGEAAVWTTFSEDQIDLNYRSPALLTEILDVLLTYARQGARYLRLDAIGFAWKQEGTGCMNLPETHALVRLLRAFLDAYAPGTRLVTETNVPSAENLRYLGDGSNEASMVYQFPLPPLVLHAFLSGSAHYLTQWAKGLPTLRGDAAFFNFLASHDGIGLRPVEGILSPKDVAMLVEKTEAHGGLISYRDNGNGGRVPYELNITYMDALTAPDADDDTRAARFLAAHTLLLSLAGVPGLYIHSLLGSRNDRGAAESSGINRRINRAKLDYAEVDKALGASTLSAKVFHELLRRMSLRASLPAFSPQAAQEVQELSNQAFCVLRRVDEQRVLAAVNVSDAAFTLCCHGRELLTNARADGQLTLAPFQAAWVLLDESEG